MRKRTRTFFAIEVSGDRVSRAIAFATQRSRTFCIESNNSLNKLLKVPTHFYPIDSHHPVYKRIIKEAIDGVYDTFEGKIIFDLEEK